MKNFEYFAPGSLPQALTLLDNIQQTAKVLAGGTDLIAQMRAGRAQPAVIIDVKNIPELNRLEWDTDRTLHIGAAVPIRTVVDFPHFQQRFSMLHQGCSLIGSTRVRNRATIGGNICNAAPSADSAPALLCLGAKALIAQQKGTRMVPIEDIFRGPGKTSLAANELLVELEIPAAPARSAGCYLRHTPREEMDIAVAGVAAFLVLAPHGKTCREAGIALSAVAPTPIRVPAADALLFGKIPNRDLIAQVAEKVAAAASPISDIRSSAEYRRELVRVLTRRALQAACETLNIQIEGGD
jgi:carbon-monoxide dehydrogenase medium subunit